MNHLRNEVKNICQNFNDKDRIDYVLNFQYIGYELADNILMKFKDLLEYPKCSRMPNILLFGDSGNGKTVILERFIQLNPSYIDPKFNELITPILFIEAPHEMTENNFYDEILLVSNAGMRFGEKTNSRKNRVLNVLNKLKVKVIIVDEIHNLLSGTARKQRLFLNLVKYLSNTLKISMIFSGTKDALNALSTDPQLVSRFERNELIRWKLDQNFLILMASFEEILPLREESFLREPGLATKIFNKSEGTLGEITKVLRKAAIMAIRNGEEKITTDTIDNIDYLSPSKIRKR